MTKTKGVGAYTVELVRLIAGQCSGIVRCNDRVIGVTGQGRRATVLDDAYLLAESHQAGSEIVELDLEAGREARTRDPLLEQYAAAARA